MQCDFVESENATACGESAEICSRSKARAAQSAIRLNRSVVRRPALLARRHRRVIAECLINLFASDAARVVIETWRQNTARRSQLKAIPAAVIASTAASGVPAPAGRPHSAYWSPFQVRFRVQQRACARPHVKPSRRHDLHQATAPAG